MLLDILIAKTMRETVEGVLILNVISNSKVYAHECDGKYLTFKKLFVVRLVG